MITQSKLIPISYYDPKSEVRLSAYADTIVYEPELAEKTLRAIRFGGYPEMVRAMSDAIYAGASIDAEVDGKPLHMLSQVKRYQRQISHDGVYAEATLLSLDDDQDAQEESEETEGQENLEEKPRKCCIFCPQGDRDRLFEELDRKTAVPLIPAFRDYVLEELERRNMLKELTVISLREKLDAWVLHCQVGDQNIVDVVEDGLRSGKIGIPGADSAENAFEGVDSVTGYLNTFGVTVAQRICRHATRIASEASPVEELRGVLLEADETEQVLTVTATNFELSLRCRIGADVRENGAWVVNAKMLTGMLGLLPGEKIALYGMSNGTMQLAGGACRYAVGVLPGRGYPKTEIPFPEDTVQVSGIPSLAKRTVFAVSENEEQPVMRCVNLVFSENGLRAVGSDGSRVMSVKGEAKSAGTISLLVPAKSITALAGMVSDQEVLSVGTTGQSVVFMRENFIFSARLMAGTYINADALLQSVKASFTVLTDGEALWRALDAVITVADEAGKVCLHFEGGHIKLQCDCADGSARGELEVIPLTGKPSGCYYYPAKKLAECLRVLGGTLQLEVAQNGLLLLDTEQATCLQSAVRAPTAQKAEKKMSAKAA